MKIGIIEDQAMFRDFLKKIVEDHFKYEVVAESETGEEGIRLCREFKPDLLLLDLNLPDMEGLDVAYKILRELPRLKVLALSSEVDDYTLYKVLNSGIHGYVDKNAQPMMVLKEAIEVISHGRLYFTAVVQEARQALSHDPNAFSKILTPREQTLLSLMGCGLSNEEIAEKTALRASTIQGHRRNIMGKLNVHTTPELIRYAVDKGFAKIKSFR